MAPNVPPPHATPKKSNTVRNVVLGCAVVLLVVSVAAAFAFYQFVWKPGRELIASGGEVVERVEEMSRLEDGVEDRSPYTPPADRRLSEGQVERFVAVHQAVRTDLGPRWEQIERRYSDVDGNETGGGEPSFTDMLGFWRDLGGVATDAKRRQVEALNEQGFSLAEYEWVRGQVYAALGMGQLAVGIDELVASMEEGGLSGLGDIQEQQQRMEEAVPAENRALVEPYREQLEEWAPLAMLGL